MKKIIILSLVFISTVCFAQKPTLVVADGHNYGFENLTMDKQGKYIYTAETDRCIMWEAKTGRQLYSLPLTGAKFRDYIGMDVNPDGSKIAIASDGLLFFFDTKNGKKIELSRLSYEVDDLKFSVGGNYIYLATNNGIHVLDANTFTEKESIKEDFTGYSPRIWTLSDNKVLVAGSITQGTGFRVYDLNTKQKISAFDLPDERQYGKFTFLPKQNTLAAVSAVGLDFYDIYTGTKKGNIACMLDNGAILASQNTDEILISGEPDVKGVITSSSFGLYSTESFKKINTFKNRFSVNGGYFNGLKKQAWFSIGNIGAGNYDLTSKKITVSFKGIMAAYIKEFSTTIYNEDNGYLHFITNDKNFKTIDLGQMKPLLHRDLKERPDNIAVSFTGDTVAVFIDNVVTIKNIVTGAVIKKFSDLGFREGGSGHKNSFFFSSDNKYLFYPIEHQNRNELDDTYLIRMNVATGVREKYMSTKGSTDFTVNFDKEIVTGYSSGYQFDNISLWDLATGRKLFTKDEKSYYTYISNDKKRILLYDFKYFRRYDIATNKLLDSLDAKKNDIRKVELFNGDFSSEIKLYSWPEGINNIGQHFFSPNGKVFYTIESFDNKIKAWEAATNRFIGTLYLFKETNDYVFMDADGRFDGTSEGVKQIYYVINQKPLPLDRIFERYYTPNLYARSVAGEKFDKIDVIIKSFPKAKISYAEAKRNLNVEEDGIPVYKNTTGFADITVNASAEDDAIDEIRLFQNGKIVTLTTRNLIGADNTDKTDSKKYKVALLPGVNNIRAIALNTQRSESEPDDILVNYNNGGANNEVPVPVNNSRNAVISAVDKTATMYLVVIGINKYQNEKLSLNYALADATAFKDEIEKDAKTVLGNVKTFFVTDNTADKKGITDALTEVQKNAKPQDLFVFYYAGHGYISDKTKEFYLVPTDVADIKNVDEVLLQKGISAKMLQTYAIDIQAQKQIFILDACQSAGAFEALLTADANQQKSLAVVSRSTGTHWMAASGSKQYAQEFATLKHGAFTYVLLQALQGQAAANKMITVNGLKTFMQVQVPELMKKYNSAPQYPASYGLGNDFPVEIVK